MPETSSRRDFNGGPEQRVEIAVKSGIVRREQESGALRDTYYIVNADYGSLMKGLPAFSDDAAHPALVPRGHTA
jgi:hypothetical protein